MLSLGQQFLEWITAHPHWALALLGVVSLVDAIFIIGAFVPASIVLFALGALVALGSLELCPTAAVAAAGAVMGDGLSFWLGRRYGERLFQWKPLAKYPDMVEGGRRFFARHGGKGVMLARFLGPVRAVTPAVAGASGMPAWQFLLADSVAAYLWALVYIVPGVVFGASLGLAAEVAGRLASLLVLSFVVIGMSIWLTRASVRMLQAHAERLLGAMLDWSRRHRTLGRFGATLADQDQPETPALAIVALSLLLGGAVLLLLAKAAGFDAYPPRIDALVYQTLHGLQTPWGSWLALAVAQLGDPTVYGPVAMAVLVALVLRRKHRAAAHWIAALAFGGLISLGLNAMPILPSPLEYVHGLQAGGFVVRDLVMVTVIYGFIPVLLSTQRPQRVRLPAYATSTVLLSMIVLARLYLGVEWCTLAMLSLAVGLLWLAALGLGYRRHAPDRVFGRGFLLPVLAVFVFAAGLRWVGDFDVPTRLMPAAHVQSLPSGQWWSGDGYVLLPAQRLDVRGRPGIPFDLQWAGPLPEIEAALSGDGWLPPAPVNGAGMLRWLTSSTPIDALPVLPQVHAGSHQVLVLRRPIDDTQQWLIRLWPSGWQLDDGEPVWVGTLSRQQARTAYRLLRYPVAVGEGAGSWTPPLPYILRRVVQEAHPLALVAQGPPAAAVPAIEPAREITPPSEHIPGLTTAPYSDAPAPVPVPVPIPPG